MLNIYDAKKPQQVENILDRVSCNHKETNKEGKLVYLFRTLFHNKPVNKDRIKPIKL